MGTISRMFPKSVATVVLPLVILGTIVVAIAGGALGNEFGGGFLASPIAHIQLAAEPVIADPLFLGFQITNTMVATWFAIIVLVVFSFFATRRIGETETPKGLQSLAEVVIEFFLDLSERVAGPEKARRFLPLVMTIFLFIVVANWSGILPGFGTIGRIETPEDVIHHAHEKEEEVDLDEIKLQIFDGDGVFAITPFGSVGDEITAAEYKEHGVGDGKQAGILVPFLRSANTEINTTLAIALIAMVMVHYWGLTTLGLLGHIGKFINFKAGPIGFFVGVLEGISEIARVISFTFRLFGNIFAGEVLLVAMAFLVPLVGIIPFLGMELFVGMIQAFIFSMLTLVFAAMATVSHESSQH